MASLNLKQGAGMTRPAVTPIASSLTWQARAAHADYGRLTAQFIHMANAALLLALTHMFLNVDASIGILRFVQQDTGLPRTYLIGAAMFILFIDISFASRDTSPSWRTLSMGGQTALALLAIAYWFKGSISLIGLITYAGPYLLALLTLITIAQRRTPLRYFTHVKHMLLPCISLMMAALGLGLIVQPDSTVNQFIQTRYGLGALVIIMACLAWGAGQLRFNHIAPWKALRRMIGLYFYTMMVVYLMFYEGGVSSLAVFMLLYLSGLTVFVTMIQTQEWAA